MAALPAATRIKWVFGTRTKEQSVGVIPHSCQPTVKEPSKWADFQVGKPHWLPERFARPPPAQQIQDHGTIRESRGTTVMKFTVSHVDVSDFTHDGLMAFFEYREFAVKETTGGASKE
jgi:hypothetical protein